MRKNFLLIFASIICSYISISQKAVFSYKPFDGADLKSKFHNSYVIHDKKNERTTVMFTNNKEVDYLILNKDLAQEGILHPTNSLNSKRSKANWFKYYGGVHNNLGSSFFYGFSEDGKKNEVIMEVVDFTKKTLFHKILFDHAPGDQAINWYTNEGSFIHMSVNDKAKELIFRVVDINGNFNVKKIPVDLSSIIKGKRTLSQFFSFSQVFTSGDEIELAAATDLTKIYVYPDKLVMVVTDFKEPTIWTIDTRSFKIASVEKLDMSGFVGFSGKKEEAYNNSFLFGENLFVQNISKNKIEIGVFDFTSKKLKKKHEFSETSSIPFLETPVEIISAGRRTRKNVINSNKELLKELYKGNNGIAVALNENEEIIVTNGSYNKERKSSGGYAIGGFSPASMPTGSTYAGSNIPVMRTYSNYNSMANYRHSSGTYDFIRTVNFKIALHPTTFEIIKTTKKLSGIERINAFLETIDENAIAESIFKSGNKHFISYYLPDNKTFYVKDIKL